MEPDERVDIKGMTLPELTDWMTIELGASVVQARNVFQHLWQKGTLRFSEMDGVSWRLLKVMEQRARISVLEPAMVLRSIDGTVKFVWELHDGHQIESVLIPSGDRVTLCMSTQVGCAMACTFCLTGDLGLKRHLTPAEIASQALQVGLQAAARTLEGSRPITNVVFMGMGEPLHNLDNLCTSLDILLDGLGLDFSHRKVTVSTVGLVKQLRELAERSPVNLAVSLNATTDAHRSSIMPVNRRYPIGRLLEACREVPLPTGKRITFEYVMFAGDNDTLEDADRLAILLKDVPAKVNLIPYNSNPDRDLLGPDEATVNAFQNRLIGAGLHTAVRTPRGRDISAACGQLGKAAEQARSQGWLQEARSLAGLD